MVWTVMLCSRKISWMAVSKDEKNAVSMTTLDRMLSEIQPYLLPFPEHGMAGFNYNIDARPKKSQMFLSRERAWFRRLAKDRIIPYIISNGK